MWTKIFFILATIQIIFAKHGFGPTDQDWGHVAVRDGAYIFWWLHYTTANVTNYADRPLIIWLQGGPGSSSTGYGNFAELGPLDVDLKPRSTSWVQWANILFVDNPVGTGFGYVEDDSLFAKSNTEIAKDFLVFLKGFLDKVPIFKGVPLYIFCESYGGKMTAEIALIIDEARRKNEIDANLKGIGLGDSWISSGDSILGYAPFLYSVGRIDKDGYNRIIKVAKKIKSDLNKNESLAAEELWGKVNDAVYDNTYGIDSYNILTKIAPQTTGMNYLTRGGLYHLTDDEETKLLAVMNDKVKPALNLTQTWSDGNGEIYQALISDFMSPVTTIVERLLNETDMTVAVYNGQLDFIVDTPGTYSWVENLNFHGKQLWEAASRNGFAVNDYYEGYVKKYGKFAFYWVDRAGHMVPKDNPSAMYYILKDVTNNFKK